MITGPRSGQYLTHRVVPENAGRGADQADIKFSVLEEYNSIDSLCALVMDNTSVNTGHIGGLCVCLEKKLGRKLHLIGCMLHINELPLRNLIKELDGPTISGNKLGGPIGKLLDGDELYRSDPVNFEPVECGFERPEPADIEDLSDDQRILLEYMFGVSSGSVDDKFVMRKPGPLCHSRWLTTAIRILILYTRTVDPSETLKLLVLYIVRVYAPAWFVIKMTNKFICGPDVYFDIIQAVKKVEEISQTFFTPRDEGELTLKERVFKVLGRNAFCCLPENFLASLLYSHKQSHRQIAVDKIMEIRAGPKLKLVTVKVPPLNFEASEWGSLVDLSTMPCHEPPCVTHLSNEELEAMRTVRGLPPDFPLHSQSVERAVKLTSEASKRSYVWERRHKYIVATNKSRAQRPQFRSKSDYI